MGEKKVNEGKCSRHVLLGFNGLHRRHVIAWDKSYTQRRGEQIYAKKVKTILTMP